MKNLALEKWPQKQLGYMRISKLNNPLIKGSIVIFLGTMVANFGGYLYHLFMGRMLGPENYGVLTALISILYIISIPASSLGTTMVKFASTAKVKKDYRQIFSLFYELSRKLLVVSLAIFLLFVFASKPIASFLQITDQRLIFLTGSLFLISFLPMINNGVLQAFLKFSFLAANNIFGAILKIGLAIILVALGFSVGGAIAAFFLASIVIYLVSFLPLRFLWRFKSNGQRVDWSKMAFYAGPVFLSTLGLTSLYTTDVILVKHFFSAPSAGLYAALAVMGKIIFYASSAIGFVMFPLVSERYENGGQYRLLLVQSLVLVSAISLGITGFYFLYPKLMIKVLYGSSYLAVSPYLGLFGIFISLYSLANVFISFFFSIRKTKVAVLVLLAALAQIVLIWLFHGSILAVIQVSILVAAVLIISLLIYYLRYEKT